MATNLQVKFNYPFRLSVEEKAFVHKVVRHIKLRIRLNPGLLSITFVENHMIKELNTKYRNKPKETDVLTFCLEESGIVADVYIAPAVVAENAHKNSVDYFKELAWVISHAFAHIAGYDHHHKADYSIMKDFEAFLLKDFS